MVREDLTDLHPLRINVDILKVYDGDTVLVKKGSYEYKVRLARIDAPEKGQNFLSAPGDAGAYSHKCLSNLLKRKGKLEIYGTDMYGRILGDIDGVSFKLVQQGCVGLYPHAKFKDQNEKYKFLRALMKAKRLKFKIWAFGGFEQPKAWRSKNKNRFKKRT